MRTEHVMSAQTRIMSEHIERSKAMCESNHWYYMIYINVYYDSSVFIHFNLVKCLDFQ